MNYLAHLLLSHDQSGVVVGNFIGDLIKGRSWQALPEDIARGVLLHRFIDDHADSHPTNAKVRKQLHPFFGKYAGVALDLYYDYFLARQWEQHCEQGLTDFLEGCNGHFLKRFPEIPESSAQRWRMIYGMGWMEHYDKPSGLQEVFSGMDGRIPHTTGFERGAEVLSLLHDALERGFNDYFPELRLAANAHLRKLAAT